jgi:hypothetical protein
MYDLLMLVAAESSHATSADKKEGTSLRSGHSLHSSVTVYSENFLTK